MKLGWRGFDQAERQLLDEIQESGDPLVPLAHLMEWAYAIDQWYTARIADGQNELVRLFGADTVGETYNGFRAARASVAHGPFAGCYRRSPVPVTRMDGPPQLIGLHGLDAVARKREPL